MAPPGQWAPAQKEGRSRAVSIEVTGWDREKKVALREPVSEMEQKKDATRSISRRSVNKFQRKGS